MKFSLPTLLLALIVPLSLPAVGADLFDPEDGMLDMSRYLQDNQYGFLPVPVVITDAGWRSFYSAADHRFWRRRNAERDLVRRRRPPAYLE